MTFQISIIIPVLNEAERLSTTLARLQSLRDCCQLILVDGGSTDNSIEIAQKWVDKVLTSPRGRALQMNFGTLHADADIFLFLHADTSLPSNATSAIQTAVARGYLWGRFNVEFDSTHPAFKLIAFMMNWRSRLTGIATGDQSLFMTRDVYYQISGFPPIALMEDIAICQRLKCFSRPACLNSKIITSARRWQQHGIVKIIFSMWCLRLAYFLGADPDTLAGYYYGKK